MKTSELTGFRLDFAVAKAAGEKAELIHGEVVTWKTIGYHEYRQVWRPSTDWEQAGPIIEREKVSLEWTGEDWMAYIWHDREYFGRTPLIAAMRSYVDHVIGDEVELPEGVR
jgi:hypothetical protein